MTVSTHVHTLCFYHLYVSESAFDIFCTQARQVRVCNIILLVRIPKRDRGVVCACLRVGSHEKQRVTSEKMRESDVMLAREL